MRRLFCRVEYPLQHHRVSKIIDDGLDASGFAAKYDDVCELEDDSFPDCCSYKLVWLCFESCLEGCCGSSCVEVNAFRCINDALRNKVDDSDAGIIAATSDDDSEVDGDKSTLCHPYTLD